MPLAEISLGGGALFVATATALPDSISAVGQYGIAGVVMCAFITSSIYREFSIMRRFEAKFDTLISLIDKLVFLHSSPSPASKDRSSLL